MAVQAASRAANPEGSDGATSVIQGGVALTDSTEGTGSLLREGKDPLTPSGLLNIVVVRGGINMGTASDRAPQR